MMLTMSPRKMRPHVFGVFFCDALVVVEEEEVMMMITIMKVGLETRVLAA